MSAMELKTYLLGLERSKREDFAKRCKTTMGHMHNVMHGYRPCSPELAALIDSNSKGIVGRHELRPNDWREIWPELSKRKSLKEAA